MITPLIKSFLIKFKNKWKKNLLIKKKLTLKKNY